MAAGSQQMIINHEAIVTQVRGAGVREGGGCGARGGVAGEGSEEHVAPGCPYCTQHPAGGPQAHHHAGHHQM